MTPMTVIRKSLALFVRRQLVGVSLIMFFVMTPTIQADASTPLDSIQKQVNRLLDVLRDPSFKALPTEKEKTDKIWPIVDEIFDYRELSKRALSRNWRKLDKEQRREFTELFSKLLGNIYMGRLLKYTDEKVTFDQEKMLSKNKAEVETTIVTASAEIPINYRMFLKNGEWRVYDVVIEGISMVVNYRNQFQQILAKQTPEEFLKMLRKKVSDI
jgi:phospholipid transport system substrate-binding protein